MGVYDEPDRIICVYCGQKLSKAKKIIITEKGKQDNPITDDFCLNKKCQLFVDLSKIKTWEKVV